MSLFTGYTRMGRKHKNVGAFKYIGMEMQDQSEPVPVGNEVCSIDADIIMDYVRCGTIDSLLAQKVCLVLNMEGLNILRRIIVSDVVYDSESEMLLKKLDRILVPDARILVRNKRAVKLLKRVWNAIERERMGPNRGPYWWDDLPLND